MDGFAAVDFEFARQMLQRGIAALSSLFEQTGLSGPSGPSANRAGQAATFC